MAALGCCPRTLSASQRRIIISSQPEAAAVSAGSVNFSRDLISPFWRRGKGLRVEAIVNRNTKRFKFSPPPSPLRMQLFVTSRIMQPLSVFTEYKAWMQRSHLVYCAIPSGISTLIQQAFHVETTKAKSTVFVLLANAFQDHVKRPTDDEWIIDPAVIFEMYGASTGQEGVDFVVDGGLRVADPSTVVDMTGSKPKLLRKGKGVVYDWMITEDSEATE